MNEPEIPPRQDPASTVISPCVRLCTLNDEDVCVGCGRTLADITGWTRMADADKRACIARARERLIGMGRPLPPLHSDIGEA